MWLVCNSVVNGPAVNKQLDKYCAGNFLLRSTECHCIYWWYRFYETRKTITYSLMLVIEFKYLVIWNDGNKTQQKWHAFGYKNSRSISYPLKTMCQRNEKIANQNKWCENNICMANSVRQRCKKRKPEKRAHIVCVYI